jgi:hypothetical protein
MSTHTSHPDRNGNDLIAVTQRVGSAWRCLFASSHQGDRSTVLETIEVDGDHALESLLESKQPELLYSILPGSSTVCRTTTLPDVDADQIIQAIRLQAESKFLGGTPDHRRAMAPLDTAAGETNRVGLIVAWPENSKLNIPACLQDALFIPDAGAIAALLDGFRPTEPIVYADQADGTVTLAMSHANGAALRATREDSTSQSSFIEGITRIARETAVTHNHTPAFTDALVANLQSTISTHSFEIPILLLPTVIVEGTVRRVLGVPSDDSEWWSMWGITVGGLLAATGSLHSLTTMKLQTPVLNPSATERLVTRCSEPSTAMKLSIAAVLLLAFGPAIISGTKLRLIDFMNPELNAQYDEVVETRKQQIVYKELGSTAWPMTKIAADVINNVPIGIDIDSVRINVGEPISIRGRAINTDGDSAAVLIAKMQENLQATGMFKDIQFSYDPAGTYGDREFDVWASVVNPLKRPRYTTEQDFGRWTYAMRQAGIDPDDNDTGEEAPMPTGSTDNGSPLGGAGEGTPLLIGEASSNDTTNRPTGPRDGGEGTASRTDNPNTVRGGGTRIPDSLDPALIAQMSEDEARISLTDVTEGLQHVSRGDDETKKRLRNEMRLLLDRLKETQQ